MVRHQTPGRKERFEAALKLAGLTAEEWAAVPEEQGGGGEITRQHLYLVLKGERQSPPLLARIDAFIDKMAPTMVPTAA